MLLSLAACKKKQSQLVWNESFYLIGSQSSPRTSDLNGDGVLDIVMGAGRDETVATDDGVLAVNGLTGKLLWKNSAPAHVVGSASFQDINDDNIQDIFIGGRGGFLTAIDGKTGQQIWKFNFDYSNDSILRYARFNFYNSVWVPDQNGDGKDDLLTVNGGNWSAPAGSSDGRLPGVLMLIDSKSGGIIAADTMPDGKESYMSPVCYKDPLSQELRVVFGTGGETISGSLYVCKLQDLMEQNLTAASKVASEEGHGFIAPPTIADLNDDGTLDIAAISHAGTVVAVDGNNYKNLWKTSFPGNESSTTLAVGHFTQKDQLEVLAVMDQGTWPKYTFAQQVILDGSNGSINSENSFGCFVVSSPVIYDIDHDGFDEAILNINDYQCDVELEDEIMNPPGISHQLIAIDFQTGNFQMIDQTKGFRNIFSSPWIGDLDDDGYLDIVYSVYNHANDVRRFLGMSLKRVSTPIKVRKPVKWGAYMGTDGNGIYME
ncbi:MAG: hypothetical protein DHS20C17_14850 [Cyclobacteriaceae bacterium]|nr:MAG: hypothetical protein DHS20C17_14850 [Cyclobacteriaceae bacterium]